MTQNQIAYQNMLETQRKNLASEALTGAQLAEQGRHNKVTEKETTRANKEKEKETNRHNVRNEQIEVGKTFAKTATDTAAVGAKYLDALIPG